MKSDVAVLQMDVPLCDTSSGIESIDSGLDGVGSRNGSLPDLQGADTSEGEDGTEDPADAPGRRRPSPDRPVCAGTRTDGAGEKSMTHGERGAQQRTSEKQLENRSLLPSGVRDTEETANHEIDESDTQQTDVSDLRTHREKGAQKRTSKKQLQNRSLLPSALSENRKVPVRRDPVTVDRKEAEPLPVDCSGLPRDEREDVVVNDRSRVPQERPFEDGERLDGGELSEDGELIPAVAQFQPFPLQILPSALSEFCVQQAKSICCDPTLVLLPALAVMAAAIGNSRRVAVRNMWSEPSALWTACVAESGSGKSPAFRASTGPLDKLPLQSPLRHFVFRDEATIESIGEAASGSRGSALVCEEFVDWFHRLNDAKRRNVSEAFFLRAYEGRLAAAGSQSNALRNTDSGTLSITGTISQGDLKDVLNHERVGGAIVARLLFAMPPEQARQWSEREVPREVISRYEQLILRLAALPLSSHEAQSAAPLSLELSPRARDRFKSFYNKFGAARCDVENPRMKAAFAKVEGVAVRIALVLACARFVMGERDREIIEEKDVAAGIAAACWFVSETGRIESVLAETPEMSERRSLADWIWIHGGSIGVSELRLRRYRYRYGNSPEQALEALVRAGFGKWKSSVLTDKGGRPSRRFWLTSSSGE